VGKQTAALTRHGDKVKSVLVDATQLADLQPDTARPDGWIAIPRAAAVADGGSALRDDRPCTVIALEVLDNLPHDIVTVGGDGAWTGQVEVVAGRQEAAGDAPSTPPRLAVREEVLPGPSDVWIRALECAHRSAQPQSPPPPTNRALRWLADIRNTLAGRPPQPAGAAFVPTGALQLLVGLRACLPRADLLLADFDRLPPPNVGKLPADMAVNDVGATLAAANAPLVAGKHPGTRE